MVSKKKYGKRVFISVIILTILVAGGLFGIMHFYGDEVKQSLLGEINAQMKIEVSVEEIQLDLFSSFPKASLRFKQIASKEKGAMTGNSLVKAGEIALLFNILDIFKGNYTIEKINLHDAFLNLQVQDDGTVNYKMFHANEATGQEVVVNLKKVNFKNVVISYIHNPSMQEYLFRIDRGELNGELSSQTQAFEFDGSVYSTHIKSGKNTFLKNRELTLKTSIVVDKTNHRIEFKKASLKSNGFSFALLGTVDTEKTNKTLDLNIQVERSSLGALMKLIPPEYLKPIADLSINGNVTISAEIKGNFAGDKIPAVKIDFQMEDGEASLTNSKFTLSDVYFQGTFSSDNLSNEKTYRLKLSDMHSSIQGGRIDGSIELLNFISPQIQTQFQATIDLQQLPAYIPMDTISSLNGKMRVDLTFRNRLKSFRSFTIEDFISSQTSGMLELSNMNFQLKNSPHLFEDFNGQFQFNNKDLKIDSFTGFVSGNDFGMEGYFRNILAFIFRPNESIFIAADFTSKNINLDQLLVTGKDQSQERMRLGVSKWVNYNINFRIDNFKFRKFSSTQNSGNIVQKNSIIFVNNAGIHSMEGDVLLNGSINATNDELYFIKCNADFQEVNIRKLFHDFGNFGQDNLTSTHLDGTVDAQVEYSSTLTPSLFVNQKSVYTLADIHIKNGELIRYEPLGKLSRFVKEGEFEHVKFSALKNQIKIENEVVYIPQMDIESNSMNLKLSGNHTFDNQIDYHIQLLLSEIIARKEVIEEDLGENFVVDDGLGRTMLFLNMTGEANDPTIKYDTREARNKIAIDLKEEKKEIKEVLREEFGFRDRGKTTNDSLMIIESSGDQENFRIEWEETQDKQPKKKNPTKKDNPKPPKKSDQKDFIIEWEEDNDTIDNKPLQSSCKM